VKRGAALVTAAAAGGAVVARVAARRALPQTGGTLRLECLERPVEVLRDRHGFVHIYAASGDDVARAHGYVHAQDRLFQMEMLRRFAFGRLSELVGPRTVELDRLARRLRLRWAAERQAAAADPLSARWIEAYCEGVNEFVARGPLPLELRLLRRRPEPWTAVDVQAPGQMFALTLSGNWETELLRMRLVARVGEERARRLDAMPGDLPVIVPPRLAAPVQRRARWLRRLIGQPASNSWVIAGSRTASGKPLLANDPHLLLTVPSLWHAAHLAWDGGNVAGVTVPGVPAIILGRNEHVAWGMTTAMVDTQDLYVERLHPGDPNRYEVDGKWVEAEVVREEIGIRGRAEPVVEEVVVTRHGPVVARSEAEHEALALRWSAYEPSDTPGALFDLMVAEDVDAADSALDRFAGPPHNFLLADDKGATAYRLAGGPLPARKRGDGFVPVPGWDSSYDWDGFLPPAEQPRDRDPERGFLVTANNRIVGDGDGPALRGEYLAGYRARRIEMLLEELEAATVEDCRRIALDDLSLPGRQLATIARKLSSEDELEQSALDLLADWDGRLTAESAAGAVYSVLMLHLFEAAYGDLRELESGYLAGVVERSRPAILHALAEGDDELLPAGRSWDEVFRSALAATVRELGPDRAEWRWGDRHRLRFEHAFHAVPLLGRVFDRGPYPVGGDGDTLGVFVSPAGETEGSMVGASMRAVFDLADPDGGGLIIAPGQSGHVASEHYDDLIPAWLKGELAPLPLTREGVEEVAAERLVLEPASREGIERDGRPFTASVGR
jgi:penicillin amidase